MPQSSNVRIAGIAAAIGVFAGGALSAVALGSNPPSSQSPHAIELVADSNTTDQGSRSGHGMGMNAMVSSEFQYLVDMIPHHQEAIDNARLLVDYSDRSEMREFGAAIIKTQTAEVEQMEAWLNERYPGRDTSSDYQPMMGDLTELRGDELDQRFLETMIPHHMMAVMMSQQLVRAGLAEHDDVVPFAANIRDVQRQEIHQMSNWLEEWFGDEYAHGSEMGSGIGHGMGHGMGHGRGGGPST